MVCGSDDDELTLVQKDLVEALLWFKINCPKIEFLKAKNSTTMPSCSTGHAHRFVNPLGCFVPTKKRGGGEGFRSKKGTQSSSTDHDQEAKCTGTATVDQELGFASEKRNDQEDAKSTVSSVDEVVNPLGIVVIPKEKRGILPARKINVVKKSLQDHNYYNITSYEDGLKLKIEKKTAAGGGSKGNMKRQRMDNEDGEGISERPSKKTKKAGGRRVNFKKLGLDPAPNFSVQIKARIDYQEGRDSEFNFRIMKQVFATDMNPHHDRFSMPLKQIKGFNDNFLRGNEIEGTEVKLVEMMGLKEEDNDDNNVHHQMISTLRLRKWNMNENVSYVLGSSWNDVLTRNEGILKENDIVQVYSFRRYEKLWFVLIKIMDADEVAGCACI